MTLLSPETSTDSSARVRRRRLPRLSPRAAILGLLALGAVAAAALTQHTATRLPLAPARAGAQYPVHGTTVFGSSIPAKQYGAELSKQQGSDTEDSAAPGSPTTPVSPSAF